VSARNGEFRFQFDGIPYTDIIRRFCQMAEKPLLGEPKVDGTMTFFDAKPYTFDEAVDMLNLMLAMKGFTLIETPRYMEVVPLVTATKSPLKIVKGMEAAKDVRPGEIVTMMLPLTFLTADDAIRVLQPVVSVFGSVAPLGRGRGILITDRLENIRRIKVLLDEMDTSTLSPPGERILKTFVLKNASARDIATIINNIFGAGGLGVGGAGGAGVIPRYIRNPENGEWMRNPEWAPEGQAGPGHVPGATADASVKCSADERTNTLFVGGPPDKVAMAEELIMKLDEIRPEQTGDMRIFELKNAKAEDVANTLRQILLGQQVPTRRYGQPEGEPQPYEGRSRQPEQKQGMQTRVVADAATNRVIVTAPLDQMNRIEDIIKQLDQANIKYVGGIKVFPLKVADAQQLAGVVGGALRRAAPQEMSGRGMVTASGVAQVSADTRTNSLIVAGSASDIQTAESLIMELDKPLEGREAREVHVVQLKAGDARQVATALTQLLRQQAPEGGGPEGRFRTPVSSNVRVEPESATNSLLISAAPGDWETIKQILDQIEKSVVPQTISATRLIPLKFAKATSLAETLNQIYGQASRARGGSAAYGRGQVAGGAPQVPVTIVADERSNTLVVSAAEDDQKAIGDMVAKMDVQGADSAEQIRIIRLKAGDAVKIAENLRGLYPAGGRGQTTPIFIQGDVASNALMVRAPDVEFKIIEKLAQSSA
jgi:type II secretory pathway component GspD/PulD (secretin)